MIQIDTLLKHRVAQKGIDYSLTRLKKFLSQHGSLQDKLPPIIHIAGTNGKGSTLTFIASLLQAAGCRVGTFISPHLVRYNERFCINGQPILDDDLMALYLEATTLSGQDTLTEFEILTVMGFLYFSRHTLDYLILETGLGGRHDATNVVTPAVTVITRIGLDHTDFLGPTLTHIATEKAGIIKPGIPLVTIQQAPEVQAVFMARSHEMAAPLYVEHPLDTLPEGLKLRGSYQKENLPLALKVVSLLKVSLSKDAEKKGLENAQILGRFNQITTPEGLLILDGAHNGIGIQKMIESLHEHAFTPPITIVFGLLKSKSLNDILPQLDRPEFTLYYCDFELGRSHSFSDIASKLSSSLLPYALGDPLPKAACVVITGSLYFLGDFIQKSPPLTIREWYNQGKL